MIDPDNMLGYLLAVCVAFAGAAGARLQNTGELSRGMRKHLLPVLLLTILYAISGLAALFYFSWAHLRWTHIVTFLVVQIALTSWVARTQSRALVWSLLCGSVIGATLAEIALVLDVA